MSCGTLANISISCTNAPATGVAPKSWLIEKEVWERATLGTKTNNTYPSIALFTGDKAYTIEVPDGGNAVRINDVIGETGQIKYTNEVDVVFPDFASVEAIRAMETSKFVLIVRRNAGTEAAQFLVLGEKTGLILEGVSYDSSAKDGAIFGTFRNKTAPVAEFEPLPPALFFNTDIATTIAALEVLETPAT